MRPGTIGIARAVGRFGMAGDAVDRICLRVKQMAGQTTRNDDTASGSDISGNRVTTKAVREISTGRGVVVVVRYAVRRYARTAGVTGSGLP